MNGVGRYPVLLALALGACSGGDHGFLMPVAGPGVALVSTQGRPADTARLTAGDVSADADATWTNDGETLEIAYHAGAAPVSIGFGSASTWHGQEVRPSHIWDTSAAHPTNGVGEPLHGPALHLRAGEHRKLLIEYSRRYATDRRTPAVPGDRTVTSPQLRARTLRRPPCPVASISGGVSRAECTRAAHHLRAAFELA